MQDKYPIFNFEHKKNNYIAAHMNKVWLQHRANVKVVNKYDWRNLSLIQNTPHINDSN